MKLSERTKHCMLLKWIFIILHALALIGPFAYCVPKAFIQGETTEKVAISISAMVSIALVVISFFLDFKHKAGMHKSAIWILLAACIFILQEVKPFILVLAIVSVIDEMAFVPLYEHYSRATATNKEIDRRNQ